MSSLVGFSEETANPTGFEADQFFMVHRLKRVVKIKIIKNYGDEQSLVKLTVVN